MLDKKGYSFNESNLLPGSKKTKRMIFKLYPGGMNNLNTLLIGDIIKT